MVDITSKLTRVTPANTTLTLLRMMIPTKSRLICLDIADISSTPIDDENDTLAKRKAKRWVMRSGYAVVIVLAEDGSATGVAFTTFSID